MHIDIEVTTHRKGSKSDSWTTCPFNHIMLAPPWALIWLSSISSTRLLFNTTRRATVVMYFGKFWDSCLRTASGLDEFVMSWVAWRSISAYTSSALCEEPQSSLIATHLITLSPWVPQTCLRYYFQGMLESLLTQYLLLHLLPLIHRYPSKRLQGSQIHAIDDWGLYTLPFEAERRSSTTR